MKSVTMLAVVCAAVALTRLSLGAQQQISGTPGSPPGLVASGPLRLQTDLPGANATVNVPFIVAGWTIDQIAASGTGMDTVHVWAIPPIGPPTFLGVAGMGGSRPD